MISSRINVVMTVIGFAVSTMFIVFVCTRLICARIRLNASRRSFPTASRSDLSIIERGLHGIEPAAVAKFPTKKYNDPVFSAFEDAQCTVCLTEYQGVDVLRILPYCGHSFHVTCIDIWLHQHSTCPVCRMSLCELPERKRRLQPLFSSAIRSHYGTESFNIHSYCYPLNNHGSRTHTNRSMDPIQEDHTASAIRSHYGTESFNIHSYCYPLNNHGSRTHTNRSMDPIQEDHTASEGDGADARENAFPLNERNLNSKDITNKHVESPSHP